MYGCKQPTSFKSIFKNKDSAASVVLQSAVSCCLMQSAEVGVWVWLQGDEIQSVLWAELSSVYQPTTQLIQIQHP